MVIVHETVSEIIGHLMDRQLIFEGSLREWPMMREITPIANGGVKIRILEEDEFGLDSFLEIILDPEDLQIIKNAQLFNDPLV